MPTVKSTTSCTGDKDARDCRGIVRTLLAASATLQSARHPVPRHQLVSSSSTKKLSST